MGTQGRRRLSGAGRGASVSLTEDRGKLHPFPYKPKCGLYGPPAAQSGVILSAGVFQPERRISRT